MIVSWCLLLLWIHLFYSPLFGNCYDQLIIALIAVQKCAMLCKISTAKSIGFVVFGKNVGIGKYQLAVNKRQNIVISTTASA